jgi:uncharacterized membrane protein
MELIQILFLLATLLCSLVAGFLFAFAVVVMPGIKNLGNREFLRVFQVIDGIIQKNQPIFTLVWVGSVVALVIAAVLGFGQLDGAGRLLLVLAALAYLLGVQLPTATINVPLNNKLQILDLDTMDEAAQKAARENFEPSWNRWNSIRTALATLATALLMILISGF